MSLNLDLLRGQFLALELQAVNRQRERESEESGEKRLNDFSTIVCSSYLILRRMECVSVRGCIVCRVAVKSR